MSDLISREKLKDDIAVLLERNGELIDEWLANCIDDAIDEQPAIEVEAIPIEWIEKQKAGCVYGSISYIALEALLKTWREEKDEVKK